MKVKSGWNKSQDRLARRLIGDYPIVDARVDFRSVVLPQDIKGAKGKDPNHCALARSIGRQTGMDRGIAIFHTVAYAPFDKKGDGKITIERLYLDAATKRAIEKFDRTGEFSPGEYVFRAVPKSQRFSETRHRNKTVRKNQKSGWHRKPRVSMLGVRNGTGKNRGAAAL